VFRKGEGAKKGKQKRTLKTRDGQRQKECLNMDIGPPDNGKRNGKGVQGEYTWGKKNH